MTIAFTRLFTTQGLLCGGLNETNTFRTTTLDGRKDDLRTQLVTSPVYDELVSPLEVARDAVDSTLNPWVSFVASLSLSALFDDVLADRNIANPTLNSVVTELARQMVIATESVSQCPSTLTNTAIGSPAGDPTFNWVTYEGLTGKVSDFIIPDVYLETCTADRSNGGTSYGETFSIVGKPRDGSPTDGDYPTGSGVSLTLAATDPSSDSGLVTDGSFNSWTTNTPNNWTIAAGVAGTTIYKASDDPRSTGFSLRFLGDGSTIHKVRQQLTAVEASTAYAVHARIKKVTDPGTDWAVSFLLVDSSGTALAGPAAYANTKSSAASTGIAASWANPIDGTFITPAVIPATGVFLEIRFHQSGSLTTAAQNLSDVYVDHVCVHATGPNQFYAAGPKLVIYSGTAESVVGDAYTGTAALASGSVGDFLIRGMDRMLGLASLSARLPVLADASSTQKNALVV